VKQVKTGEVALIHSQSAIKPHAATNNRQDAHTVNNHTDIAKIDTTPKPIEMMTMGGLVIKEIQMAFHGKVTDASGRPVAHASVRLVGTTQVVYTDEKGNYQLVIQNCSNVKGKMLMVSAAHYQQVSEPLDSAKNFELNFHLVAIQEKNDNTLIMGKMTF
jgi:hypothetical protein